MLRPRHRALGAPITTTTDDVDVMVNVLKNNLDNLDNEITGWYGSVDHTPDIDKFAAGWDGFRKEVRAFIYQWQTQGTSYIKAKLTPGGPDPGPFLKLAWQYYDNAKAYIDQNRQWRDRYTQISGNTPVTPDFQAPSHNPEAGSPESYLQWAAVGLGLVALIMILKKPSSTVVIQQPQTESE